MAAIPETKTAFKATGTASHAHADAADLINDFNLEAFVVDMGSIATDHMYQSANPAITRAEFVRLGTEAKRTKAEMLDDAARFCYLSMSQTQKWGTVVSGVTSLADKFKNKSKETGLAKFKQLQLIYKLKPTGLGAANLAATDITIPRVVSAFPWLMSQMMIARPTELRPKGVAQLGLPAFLMHPSGASLIPEENPILYRSWMKWSMSFSLEISAGDAKKAADQDTADFYGRIQWKSKDLSREQRVKLLGSLYREASVSGMLSPEFAGPFVAVAPIPEIWVTVLKAKSDAKTTDAETDAAVAGFGLNRAAYSAETLEFFAKIFRDSGKKAVVGLSGIDAFVAHVPKNNRK